MYINITKHCQKRIRERNPKHNTPWRAKMFWVNLMQKFFALKENKGRKIRITYLWKWEYKITDWIHQFIYIKSFGELIVKTYVQKEQELWKELRSRERYL